MSPRLPFEVREAIVQVCGKAFWLKDPLRAFLLSAGVAPETYDRYSDESKFKIARHVLSELDGLGDDGWLVQRRIVTDLCKLRGIPDSAVVDRDSALNALRYLKEVAAAHQLLVTEQQHDATLRQQQAKRRQAALAARAKKTEELRAAFTALATSQDDPQGRGYSLEDLLAELFELHDISYRRPYRTATEQIDGHFEFKGFDYLVEARWRVTQPTEADLAAFKIKVDKKISSTRGLFVSIPGFRPEVVVQFTQGVTSSIVLMDGQDLALILEGQVSLNDALELKIQKAAQEGIVYLPLSQRYL